MHAGTQSRIFDGGNGSPPRRAVDPTLAAGLPAIAPQKLMLYTLTALIAVVYVFSFNFVPDQVRDILSALLAFSCIASFAMGLPDSTRSGAVLTMAFSLAVMLTIAVTTLLAYRPMGDIAVIIRNFTGIFLIAWALMQNFYSRTFSRFLVRIGLVVIAMCVLLAFFNDPIFRGGTFRMGSITSGNDVLHPSAYLCVIALFWAVAIAYFRRSVLFAIIAIFVFTVLTILFEAEAAQVLLFFLFGTTALSIFLTKRVTGYLTYLTPLLVILSFLVFFIVLYFTQESWDIYTGSGRIGTWIDRFQRIGQRSWMERLFGLGPNSDQLYGSLTWVRKATHSHNDFINVALELGLVGLLAFVTMMIAMVFAAPVYLRFFVTLLMIAPFLSGGILFKPTVAPIMALAIMHVRMMYDEARIRSGGRAMRRPLFSSGRGPALAPRPTTAQ